MIKRFLIIKQSIKKDNYQILGVKVESLSEDISHLPQVIYKEKTDQCHAKYDSPQD